MIDIFKLRLRQGHRTTDLPDGPALPERFRGRPALKPERCAEGCSACADACPTGAVEAPRAGGEKGGFSPLKLDLGRCLFCSDCVAACPDGAIAFTNDHRMAATRREDLVLDGKSEPRLAEKLSAEMLRVFGRSLKLRQVSAGGCSACEAELTALGNVVFDLGRFGIQFVASPRHADGLVVTGPVTEHMRQALKIAYDAVPAPKLVIAVGACGISGGPFAGTEETHGGASSVVPVDLLIPGCPPHPLTILDGMLRLLGRLPDKR